MIISESWLREWVSPDLTTAELADLLTQAGLEVETVSPQTLLGDKVVVGKIASIEKHPNADKLKVCQLEVGTDTVLTIVCGASNARAGLISPVALVGARLPNGMEIGAREVRGIASSGMICAAAACWLDQSHQPPARPCHPRCQAIIRLRAQWRRLATAHLHRVQSGARRRYAGPGRAPCRR